LEICQRPDVKSLALFKDNLDAIAHNEHRANLTQVSGGTSATTADEALAQEAGCESGEMLPPVRR